MWKFSSKQNRWKEIDMEDHKKGLVGMEARGYLSSTTIGDNIVFYGGTTDVDVFSDTKIFNTSTLRFLDITPMPENTIEEAPNKEAKFNIKKEEKIERFGHGAVVIGCWLVVFGGSGRDGCESDVNMLHLERMKWYNTKIGGDDKPEQRAFCTVTMVGKKMYVIGGGGSTGTMFMDV